jgi:aspartyl-tRNA(Asn)/glutamyl-tRNA(Gln) amidotransferase subunit C
MKLTREQVLHVAALAHLELSEAEVQAMSRDLSEILSYIEKLNELDTAQVEPLAQVLAEGAGENPSLRADDPLDCGTARELLPAAPEATPPYFRVPKVIERGE